MKILVAAGEYAPHVRTGGLGNAVAGLVEALATRGHEPTVAIPGYRLIATGRSLGAGWELIASDPLNVIAWRGEGFDRPGVYGPEPGTGYEDNWQRYGEFSLAVAALEGDFDVVHLHDAHVGPVASLLPIPAVLTIHNAAHQMLGPLDEVAELLGATSAADLVDLEWYGSASFLKIGMERAEFVTTVSNAHAGELAVEETSFGLAGVVASLPNPIVGILNGIDTTSWDSEVDPVLPHRFGPNDLDQRVANREALVARCGLDTGMVFGNVGRMARQKGLELLDEILDDLVSDGLRLVLVGNGELDSMVDEWVERSPGAVAHLPYDEDLARLVSAGSDAYLMPSEFEPSGLGQMYAMRYGAPPVVRLTGGLADSVTDVLDDAEAPTGFGFELFDSVSLDRAIRRAMAVWADDAQTWRRLQRNGMAIDWSWDARAEAYETVLRAAAS